MIPSAQPFVFNIHHPHDHGHHHTILDVLWPGNWRIMSLTRIIPKILHGHDGHHFHHNLPHEVQAHESHHHHHYDLDGDEDDHSKTVKHEYENVHEDIVEHDNKEHVQEEEKKSHKPEEKEHQVHEKPKHDEPKHQKHEEKEYIQEPPVHHGHEFPKHNDPHSLPPLPPPTFMDFEQFMHHYPQHGQPDEDHGQYDHRHLRIHLDDPGHLEDPNPLDHPNHPKEAHHEPRFQKTRIEEHYQYHHETSDSDQRKVNTEPVPFSKFMHQVSPGFKFIYEGMSDDDDRGLGGANSGRTNTGYPQKASKITFRETSFENGNDFLEPHVVYSQEEKEDERREKSSSKMRPNQDPFFHEKPYLENPDPVLEKFYYDDHYIDGRDGHRMKKPPPSKRPPIDYEYQEYNDDENENSHEKESPPIILDDFLPKDVNVVEKFPEGSNKLEYSNSYSYDDEYSYKDNINKKVAPVDVFDIEDDDSDREPAASFLDYFRTVEGNSDEDPHMKFFDTSEVPRDGTDYDFQGFNNFRPITSTQVINYPYQRPQGSLSKPRFNKETMNQEKKVLLKQTSPRPTSRQKYRKNHQKISSQARKKLSNLHSKPKYQRYRHRTKGYVDNRDRKQFPNEKRKLVPKNSFKVPSQENQLQNHVKKETSNFKNNESATNCSKSNNLINNAFNRVNDRKNHHKKQLRTQTSKTSKRKQPLNTDVKAMILNEGDRGDDDRKHDPFSKMKVKDHYFSSGPDVSDYFNQSSKPVFVSPPPLYSVDHHEEQPMIAKEQQSSKKHKESLKPKANVQFTYEDHNPLQINPFRLSLFPKFVDKTEDGDEFTTPEYTTVRTPLEPPFGSRIRFPLHVSNTSVKKLPEGVGNYEVTLVDARPLPAPPQDVLVVHQQEDVTTRRSADVQEEPVVEKKESSTPDLPANMIIKGDAPSPFKKFMFEQFDVRKHEGLTVTKTRKLPQNVTAHVIYAKKTFSKRKPKKLPSTAKVLKWEIMRPLPSPNLKVVEKQPTEIIELPRTKKGSFVYPKVAESSSYQDTHDYVQEPREDGKDHRLYRSNKSYAEDMEDNDKHYPHQYNIEIRKRFKGPIEYLKDKNKNHVHEGREKHIDKDLETNKYRNTEHKEEEHWHEKKWRKEDMKEEYVDGKPIKGLRVEVPPKYKAKESKEERDARLNSSIPFYAQPMDPESTKAEVDEHFAIPSRGFRVDKQFESWVKKDIREEKAPEYVSKATRRANDMKDN